MGVKRAGSIRALGFDHVKDEVAMKQHVGYVSPDMGLLTWHTVGRVTKFARSFRPTWDDDYCARLMETFGLRWKDKILTLSSGAKVKLAVLLALAWRPTLLILDEPTAGLDAVAKQQVFAELLAAVRDENRAVVISSHGLTDIERFADHIGLIKDGKILIEGPTADVTERFRMVDAAGAADPTTLPGVAVQSRQDTRWRALVDLQRMPLADLAARGFTIVAETPVTLEDIFIALVKGRAA
jgi:ABC-2 type transport system ATP-binding protein